MRMSTMEIKRETSRKYIYMSPIIIVMTYSLQKPPYIIQSEA